MRRNFGWVILGLFFGLLAAFFLFGCTQGPSDFEGRGYFEATLGGLNANQKAVLFAHNKNDEQLDAVGLSGVSRVVAVLMTNCADHVQSSSNSNRYLLNCAVAPTVGKGIKAHYGGPFKHLGCTYVDIESPCYFALPAEYGDPARVPQLLGVSQ